MTITLLVLFVIVFIAVGNVNSSSTVATAGMGGAGVGMHTSISPTEKFQILNFLQEESASLSSAHKSIADFLCGKKIPINDKPGSLRKSTGDKPHLRIAESTDENALECRISLGKIPVGRKCIAPCACTGSQQWIAFAEFNRLRRKDPAQWKTCRTCQQKMDCDSLVNYAGINGNMIGLVLDNLTIFRAILASIFAVFAHFIALPSLFLRFLTSRTLWQQYSQWSRVTQLPLVLKFWGAKLLLQYLAMQYLKVEKEFVQVFAEIETSIIEPNLPIIL